MAYLSVPVFLIAILAGYVLYLLIIKKDTKKAKSILAPGLFFVAIWVVIYYFILK